MISKVYVIFDSKIKQYGKPFAAPSKGDAIRSIIDAVNNPEAGQLHKYPEDFTLFELGDYDHISSKYTLHPSPMSAGVLIEYQDKKKSSIDMPQPNGPVRMPKVKKA